MAIARLTGQDATNSSATTSVTATYPSTPTQNNLLIAVVGAKSTAPSTITGWTQAIEQSTSNSFTVLYKVAGAGEATSITANNGSATAMAIGIYEYSGCATSTPFDTSAVANNVASVTSLAIGPTATLAQADELAIAGIALGNTFTSPTWTNSFNARATVSASNIGLLSSDRIVSATTALSTTGGWTTSRVPDGAIATFKAAAGGSTVNATLAASLGGLTATATATPTVNATLSAPLGSLSATAAATPKVNATLAAPLGSLTAAASATPTVSASLTATLGSLTAAATATPTVVATATAVLGALVATATATPAHAAVLLAALGDLVASIVIEVEPTAASSTMTVTSTTSTATVSRTNVTSTLSVATLASSTPSVSDG